MKAAVVYEYGAPVEVVDVELGALRDTDVLVRIEASGLCHSDVAVQTGGLPFPTPIVIGHEGAGVVEAVGSRVTAVAPGDHVILNATLACGRCDLCTKGRPTLCRTGLATVFASVHPDGTFNMTDPDGRGLYQFACLGTLSEKVVVTEISVVRIRDDVPFPVAALVGCAVTTGLGAVFNRAKVHPGATVAVIGCGGIGLSVVQGARISGAARIVAVDPVAEKRRLAGELGATDTVDPGAGDPVEQVRELTGGLGVDYAFECVGFGSLVRQSWDMLGPDGTVVAIGVTSSDDVAVLPAQEFCSTEKTLMGCVYGTARPFQDMPRYLEMYVAGQLKLDALVSRRYTLDQINDAIADLEAGKIFGRGVFAFA